MQVAERVDEPDLQQVGELAALLVRETGLAAVRTRVLEVDLLVSHVEVAAHDDGLRVGRLARLRQRQLGNGHVPLAQRRPLHRHAGGQHAFFEPLAEVAERVVPLHAMVDARQLVLRVRRVHVHEPEFREVQRLQRLLFAEYGRAGVTLLLGIAPVLAVLRQVERGLALLQLRFLQGNDVGVQLAHDVFEAFFQHGAQAVHVPRDEAHIVPFPIRQRLGHYTAQITNTDDGRNEAKGRGWRLVVARAPVPHIPKRDVNPAPLPHSQKARVERGGSG